VAASLLTRALDHEAMATIERTRESWYEAEVNRVAGEVAVKSRGSDATKAQSYFERALAVARAQKAKSWELRAAMSMARLWRDQGKRREALRASAVVWPRNDQSGSAGSCPGVTPSQTSAFVP
jgi:predicted ATPase